MSLPILPTISTSCIILSAIMVAFGWWQISKKNIKTHKIFMVMAGVFASIFFIIYSTRTIFIGNSTFGGPQNIKIYYFIFLIFHITLATTGAIFGIISLLTGFKNKLKIHRKIGPITSIIWFGTAVTGIFVYLLLYVFYHGGEKASMIKTMMGF